MNAILRTSWWRRVLFGWKQPERPKPSTVATSWHERALERLENEPSPVYLGTGDVWISRSSSDPKTFHYVIGIPGEGLVCGTLCKGFRFTGSCWHIKSMGLDDGE